MIGATVGPNDILVGKVEPRGEKGINRRRRSSFGLFL